MIQRLIDRTMDAVLWISAVVLVAITGLTFVSVISRYLLASPIPDHYDFSRLTLGVLMAWGIAYCFARDQHIDVDLVVVRLPANWQKVLLALSILLALCFTATVAAMLWSHGLDLRRRYESTFDLRLPVWPWTLLSAAGFAAAAVTLLLRLAALVLPGERARGGP